MPLIYRFSPFRFLIMFSPVLVLFGLSLWVNWKQWTGPLNYTQIIMGVFFLGLILAMILMPSRYYISIEEEGFAIQFLGGKEFYRWQEVSNFRILKTRIGFIPIGSRIIFNLSQDSPHKTEIIRGSRAVRNFIPNANQAYDKSFLSVFKPNSKTLMGILNENLEKRFHTL